MSGRMQSIIDFYHRDLSVVLKMHNEVRWCGPCDLSINLILISSILLQGRVDVVNLGMQLVTLQQLVAEAACVCNKIALGLVEEDIFWIMMRVREDYGCRAKVWLRHKFKDAM